MAGYFQSHIFSATEKAYSLFAILQSIGKLFAIYFFEEATDMVHDSEIKTVADKLVQAHYQNDRRMEKAKIFFSADDQTIRLLELTEAVPTENDVSVISFDAAPRQGIPYPSSVILVNHEDWKRLEKGLLAMPTGWGCFTDGIDCPRNRRPRRRKAMA